jgi:hypothetical protein
MPPTETQDEIEMAEDGDAGLLPSEVYIGHA